jgi:hypothetical protein
LTKELKDLASSPVSNKKPGAKTPSGVGIGEQAVDNIEADRIKGTIEIRAIDSCG